MRAIRSFICSFLTEPAGTLDLGTKHPGNVKISSKPVLGMDRLITNKINDTKIRKEIFNDALWNLLDCSGLKPPSSDFCVSNDDCDASIGERCKEGECTVDVSHCAVTGCDEHYTCDEETGKCEFVPECTEPSQCNPVVTGELCLESVCRMPSPCVESLGPMACAPTWACKGGTCIKESCDIINELNKGTCCETPAAFELNKALCCAYNPAYPGCA
jgi:hypothetical protein